MISRIWHGWTKVEDADKYESLLRADVLPGIHRIRGYNGAYLMKREAANQEIEFVTITQFVDINAVKAFAGDLPWAHLDLSSIAESPADRFEYSAGATGAGARLLSTWLSSNTPTSGIG